MIELPRKAGDFGKREKGSYKVRLIGLGGAGLNIMSRVASEGGDSKLMTVLDTDVRALKSSRAAVRLQLGGEVTHGMGCGGDPDLGRESAEMSEAQIREILRGSDLVFLCVGLGGGTGSGAAPFIAKIAREEKCFVIAAVTLPFHFEGRRRQQQALDSLTDLRRWAGALLTFENDRMGDLIVPSSGVQEAFAAADRMISQSVRAITVLLDRPGMIRVTLDDLLSLLNGKDAKCCFGFGEAEGANRADRATAEALAHHSKEQGGGLEDASSVLIHLAGDSSVTFAEVEQVAAAVSAKTNPDCKVLLGVSASQELEKKLSVAIIASVDQSRRHPREAEGGAQDLQVRPLVDLPPLVRPAPVPMPLPGTSPAPAPLTAAPAALGQSPYAMPGMNPAMAPLGGAQPGSDLKPAALGGGLPPLDGRSPGMAIPGPLPMAAPVPAPASLPVPEPMGLPAVPPSLMQGLPVPPPLAPLPSVPVKGGPFGEPGPGPFGMPESRDRGLPELGKPMPMPMPKPGPVSQPPLQPMPLPAELARGPVLPPKSPVPPAPGGPVPDAPEPPRPLRTPGTLGDPLDFPTGKGRFEGTEPTKVGGVDVDWPTFLRKKRSQG